MGNLDIFAPEIIKAGRRFSRLVPAGSEISWAQEKLFVMAMLDKNEKLAACTPSSICDSVLQAGSMGLSFNPALQHVFLIPRKASFRRKGDRETWPQYNKAKADAGLDTYAYASPSYRGFVHLCITNGGFRFIDAQLVHEKDVFEFYGPSEAPLFKMARGKRGDCEGVFVVGKLPSGDIMSHWMDVETIEKIRQCSDAPNSLMWKDFWSEGAKKSAIRRALKVWPRTPVVDSTISYLNQHEGMSEAIEAGSAPASLPPPVEILTESQVLSIHAKLVDGGFDADKWLTKIAHAYQVTDPASIPASEFETVMVRVDNAIKAKAGKVV